MTLKAEKFLKFSTDYARFSQEKLREREMNTRRKLDQARSAFEDGARALVAALFCAEVASRIQSGSSLPIGTEALKTKKAIESAVAHAFRGNDNSGARVVRALVSPVHFDVPAKYQLMLDRAELVNKGFPGFFPTPENVVRVHLLCHIDPEPGDWVLEPSAGVGNIIDVLLSEFDGVRVHALEVVPRLAHFLKENYADNDCVVVESADVLQQENATSAGVFKWIVMNPPFEKGQDMEHVMHMFDNYLAPGGRQVAIMSPGITFRDTRKFQDFRNWLQDKVVWPNGVNSQQFWWALPEKSFAPYTNANAIVVVLEKK